MAGRRREAHSYATEDHQADGDEEQDQQRQCMVCGEYPDSIICLACDHCVDIPCAARMILQSQKFTDIDLSAIDCPACQTTTHLSAEVQATLVDYLQREAVEFDVGDEEQLGDDGEADNREHGNEEENEEVQGEEDEEEEGEEEPQVMKHKSAKKSHKSSQLQSSEKKLGEKSGGSRANKRVASAKHQNSSRYNPHYLAKTSAETEWPPSKQRTSSHSTSHAWITPTKSTHTIHPRLESSTALSAF